MLYKIGYPSIFIFTPKEEYTTSCSIKTSGVASYPQLISDPQQTNNQSINRDDEETDRYVHEEDWVKGKSFSPRVHSRTHKRIRSPTAPGQGH